MSEEAKLITADILQEVVAKDFECPEEDVKIVDFECSHGSNKGENFTCILVSVKVSAIVSGKPKHELQYMAKCIPLNQYRANFLESSGGFDRECLVYGKILPMLEDLRKSCGLKPITFPRCFYASTEKKIIVMENLRAKDFFMVNYKDITIDHFKTILREIGRYHASTHHLLETYPTSKFLEDFPSLSFSGWVNEFEGGEAAKEMEMMMNSTIQTYIRLIKEVGSEEEVAFLVPKLEKFMENRRQLVHDIFEPTKKFNVLIHNDLWTNNMLFKTPEDICFVDLQFVKRCPPTIDLAYLFGSSSTTLFREKHFDELIKLYHESLTNELQLLGYPPDTYTFEDLMEDFDRSFVFGMVAGLFHSQIKVVPMDGSSGFDFDDMQSEQESEDMMEKLSRAFVDRAKAMPDFVQNILGLIKEAHRRRVL